MITLQFSTTSHIGSKLIRLGTWSDFSHVDIILPDGSLLGATATLGVAIRENDISKMTKIEKYIVQDVDSSAIISTALEQVGKPYDWKGVLNFITRSRDWEDDSSWFCSELVAYAFKNNGTPLLNAPNYRTTPRDLLMSPLLKRVE